ncbi:hypothetical protein QO002_002876 [Pararhizobium capsulatum DSM 1112]|uniref:Uncharacterized protein n=1 Tax=Pararhizobium capsulatum DSM 1112 TaxID=1121113 RepID=A0ABU0BS06_9HYPH|nr:hypothetical protein [Pararhizobium capsulatum]MDQ0320738.1 hypothetical protein [Pararhizobium capsulatum DSM 1112]
MSTTQDLPASPGTDRVFYLSEEQIEELTDALVAALDDTLRFLKDSNPGVPKH